MSEKRYDFFISYNKNDIAYAKRIRNQFRNNRLKYWWQGENSKQEYAKEISEGLASSSSFIVLLSNESAKSKWVGIEILDAIRLHISGELKILPIVVEELGQEEANYFHQILGNFNWLFFKDFASDNELILAIINQLDIKLTSTNAASFYSAESEIEQERLRKQNNIYNIYAKKALDEIFESLDNPCVLDVGCSNAENTMLRLKNRKYSHLLCIDKDQNKIEFAKNMYSSENTSFLTTDITKKSFLSMLKNYLQANALTGFDLIHISAVIIHLETPLTVLKALKEVLNEGGYIFIQDEDDGLNLAYQDEDIEPGFFSDCSYIWQYSKESGDRSSGRKIPIYLKKAGYKNIEMKTSVITSLDFGKELREDLWDLYFNPKYWVVESADDFYTKDAYERCLEYQKKHDKQKLRYMNDQIFITLGVPIYVARK